MRTGIQDRGSEDDCQDNIFLALLGATPYCSLLELLLLHVRKALFMSPFCRTLRKLRLREEKSLGQCHAGNKWQGTDLDRAL